MSERSLYLQSAAAPRAAPTVHPSRKPVEPGGISCRPPPSSCLSRPPQRASTANRPSCPVNEERSTTRRGASGPGTAAPYLYNLVNDQRDVAREARFGNPHVTGLNRDRFAGFPPVELQTGVACQSRVLRGEVWCAYVDIQANGFGRCIELHEGPKVRVRHLRLRKGLIVYQVPDGRRGMRRWCVR